MTFELHDLFLGTYPVIQGFGENKQRYHARYGITGHNGIDYAIPLSSPVLAVADGVVYETGFDAAGYGNYIKIDHMGFRSLYAHLSDSVVHKGQVITSGELIGHSGQTGLCEQPSLHFGIAPIDGVGNKIETEYNGYIDPMGSRCSWVLKDLTSPVNQIEEEPFTNNVEDILQTEAANYLLILSYLSERGLVISPMDQNGAEKVTKYLQQHLPRVKKHSFSDVLRYIHNFIFVKKL